MEEVRITLFEMGLTKVPGADGFSPILFQIFWHIVGRDVSNFYLQMLNAGMDFDTSNATNIMLLPKTTQPTSLMNFRPISLCNELYKLIAKMLVNHMKGVLNICIDQAQSTFVPGRLISDNVLIA